MGTGGRKPGGSQRKRAAESWISFAPQMAQPLQRALQDVGSGHVSTTSPRRLREASASSRVRVTARWKAAHPIGPGGFRFAPPSCGQRPGPTGPTGRPTRPCSAAGRPPGRPRPAHLLYCPAGRHLAANLPRFRVCMGVATVKSRSDRARPMVFSPRSRPRSRVPGGSARRSSSITAIRNPFPLPVFLPVPSLVASKAPLF